MKKGMRLSRLTTHFVHLCHQDSSKKEDEKMEIQCVSCGRGVNLDHALFENYVGTVKCVFCSPLMEVKKRDRVLHGASLLAIKKHFPRVQQRYEKFFV